MFLWLCCNACVNVNCLTFFALLKRLHALEERIQRKKDEEEAKTALSLKCLSCGTMHKDKQYCQTVGSDNNIPEPPSSGGNVHQAQQRALALLHPSVVTNASESVEDYQQLVQVLQGAAGLKPMDRQYTPISGSRAASSASSVKNVIGSPNSGTNMNNMSIPNKIHPYNRIATPSSSQGKRAGSVPIQIPAESPASNPNPGSAQSVTNMSKSLNSADVPLYRKQRMVSQMKDLVKINPPAYKLSSTADPSTKYFLDMNSTDMDDSCSVSYASDMGRSQKSGTMSSHSKKKMFSDDF